MARIHIASNRPRLIIGVHSPIVNGNNSAVMAATAKAQRNLTAMSGRLAFFHRAIGPSPIIKIIGTINGTNTLLK